MEEGGGDTPVVPGTDEESPVSEDTTVEESTPYTKRELHSLTNSQLKAICDEMEVKYTSSATKSTLVNSILEAQQGGN